MVQFSKMSQTASECKEVAGFSEVHRLFHVSEQFQVKVLCQKSAMAVSSSVTNYDRLLMCDPVIFALEETA